MTETLSNTPILAQSPTEMFLSPLESWSVKMPLLGSTSLGLTRLGGHGSSPPRSRSMDDHEAVPDSSSPPTRRRKRKVDTAVPTVRSRKLQRLLANRPVPDTAARGPHAKVKTMGQSDRRGRSTSRAAVEECPSQTVQIPPVDTPAPIQACNTDMCLTEVNGIASDLFDNLISPSLPLCFSNELANTNLRSTFGFHLNFPIASSSDFKSLSNSTIEQLFKKIFMTKLSSLISDSTSQNFTPIELYSLIMKSFHSLGFV